MIVNLFLVSQCDYILFVVNMIKSEENNFQKRIQEYVISYCPTQFYGKNEHGQIRSGFKNKQSKALIFRIVPLPLTSNASSFLELQKTYADLPDFSRVVLAPIQSSMNHYVPMEYFPKTFQKQKTNFSKNAKYFDEYVEKFLRVYAFYYNMRVSHGNMIGTNIGITFQGRVKLMDFAILSQKETFQQKSKKDFQDFKFFISTVLQKDENYPSKFNFFNKKQTQRWQNFFSTWHITSPLEPLYLKRNQHFDNMITLLYKLSQNIEETEFEGQIKLSLRLLTLCFLKRAKREDLGEQIQVLEEITGKIENYDVEYYNSILIGVIRDNEYFSVTSTQRLVLICCLITSLNHEYLFNDIVNEFCDQEKKRDQLLGDSLFTTYRYQVFQNLVRQM